MPIYTTRAFATHFSCFVEQKLEIASKSRTTTYDMPCAIAVPNSPLFSPPKIASILFKSSAPCSSPRVPGLNNVHGSPRPQSPAPAQPSTSSSTSISSPLSLKARRQMSESQSTVLKRKRPAMIGIPVASFSLGVESHKTETVDMMEVEENDYSVYCKRGRRGAAMEDRYSAIVDLHGDSGQAFFGVFDGHGGAKAAEFAADKIGKNIIEQVTRRGEEDMEEAVKHGYLTTDAEHSAEGVSGGTCCVTALIHKGSLAVSNAGDCRAVMSRGGHAESLTSDHRPSREDERRRIETLGGYVDYCRGVWRIQGSLAVSRGIGDQHLKQWVISDPETKILRINPDCEFLILASDGLWDKVSNQEAVDVVRPFCIGVDNPNLFSACKELANLSLTRGSLDDISVMIIKLSFFV